MFRFTLKTITLAALAIGATAQTPELNTRVQQYTGPVQHYSLDYETGELTQLGIFGYEQVGVEAASISTYANTCTTGFLTGTGPTDEFVDWGVKAGGGSGVVDTFTFGYGTDATDPTLGGPGASVEVAFYSGTTGFGTLGTEVARFSFTGLPASSGAGGFAVAAITVTLAGGGSSSEFCLPDGPIGYGYCSSDPGTTGPLIIDIATCPLGQDDAFDIYTCPASTGVLAGTFFFGGVPTASWFMDITEEDGLTLATTTVNVGAGINTGTLSDGGTAPVLDTTWPLTHTDPTGLHTTSCIVAFAGSFLPGTVVLSTPAGMQEIIVDTTTAFGFTQTGAPLGGGAFDQSTVVPKDTTLVGLTFTVQAISFGGGTPYLLSNAIDVVAGF